VLRRGLWGSRVGQVPATMGATPSVASATCSSFRSSACCDCSVIAGVSLPPGPVRAPRSAGRRHGWPTPTHEQCRGIVIDPDDLAVQLWAIPHSTDSELLGPYRCVHRPSTARVWPPLR